jgi:group I intron endonuclease
MDTELQAIIDPNSVRNRTRYSRGKIYKLVNDVNDDIYVGSSCVALCKRLYQHKRDAKKKPYPVYKYFNELGWDNVRIILIENVVCENREQLMKREQHYIDELKPKLNKYSAYVEFKDESRHGKCIHNKRKEYCIDCGGGSICIHNKRKNECIPCEGSQICEHNKRKSACKDCNNFKCDLCDKKYSSQSNLNKHYTSQKHKDKLNQ